MTGSRLAAAIAAGALLGGCGSHQPAATAPPPLAVEAVDVASPSGAEALEATGALRWRRETILSFRVAGVIRKLQVDEGDVVKKGQRLAEIDPTAIEARLAQARADVARANRDAERLEGLVERGSVSRQQAEAQRTAAADAQAVLRGAEYDSRSAVLTAPAGGVVLTRTAQTGETVAPGQPVLTLADTTSSLVLRAALPDKDVTGLRLGQPAQVRVDVLPNELLEGRVSRLGQLAGAATGEIELEITLPLRPGLRSGMIARAEIVRPAAAAARFSRVPAEAVLEASGERAFVMRLDPSTGKARRMAVRFGGFDGDEALIAGLPPGARVITAGAGYVSDGEAVSVIDPQALAARR
jgi:RND family efflux transporter MFP subunit